MLRAGSEEQWGYSPCRLFSDLPPREWMQGWESHPPSPAYETGQSTGSPCVWEMKPWSACDDTTYPPNLWRSDPLSCRAWHTRSMKMARRVGNAPTSAGFGGPCIACLPPPYKITGMRDRLIEIFKLWGLPEPGLTRFDLKLLNLVAHMRIHPDAQQYFDACIPISRNSPGIHDLCPPDSIVSENTRYTPGAYVSQFGFICFASEGCGDAVTIDLLTGEVLIFCHEFDYIGDDIVFYREDNSKAVMPKSRESIIESAIARFDSIEAFFDDWKQQSIKCLAE